MLVDVFLLLFFILTTLAIRNPHGVTLPRYVRPFAASVVETFGFDNAN
jgi:hypothetical protein